MFTKEMIAPCGLDCSLCIAHLDFSLSCPGCWSYGKGKPEVSEHLSYERVSDGKSFRHAPVGNSLILAERKRELELPTLWRNTLCTYG